MICKPPWKLAPAVPSTAPKTLHAACTTQDVQPDPTLRSSAVPVACVDIGGTKVATSVVDARGLHARLIEPTCKTGIPDAVAQQVIRLVRQSCASAGLAVDDLAAVGVSSCGAFVVRSGLIELAAPNICGGVAGTTDRLPNNRTTALLQRISLGGSVF